MNGLRSKLPESIGSTVVSVRSQGNSGYVLADLGKEQETIEGYRKGEDARLMATAASQAAIRASRTVTGQIEALFTLGKDVTTDDIFNAVFEGKRTQNNQTRISRALWILQERLNEKGQNIVRGIINGKKTYVRVQVEDAEKVKDKLAKKRDAGRTPKTRTITKSPSPEIILEDGAEVDISPFDVSDSARMRNKTMSPEEIQATWQRIAWDATAMFLSSMAILGILNEGIGLEKNFEVIIGASLPEKRLAMFRKSTEISLLDLINAIRMTVEEAWTQIMTPPGSRAGLHG